MRDQVQIIDGLPYAQRGPGCEEWPVTAGDDGLWAGPLQPPVEPVDAEPTKETT